MVLCDPTEELLDECRARAVSPMCQIVHQLGRKLKTSGVELHQSSPEPVVGQRELDRLVDSTRATREGRLQRMGTVRGENEENVSAFAQAVQFVQ